MAESTTKQESETTKKVYGKCNDCAKNEGGDSLLRISGSKDITRERVYRMQGRGDTFCHNYIIDLAETTELNAVVIESRTVRSSITLKVSMCEAIRTFPDYLRPEIRHYTIT